MLLSMASSTHFLGGGGYMEISLIDRMKKINSLVAQKRSIEDEIRFEEGQLTCYLVEKRLLAGLKPNYTNLQYMMREEK